MIFLLTLPFRVVGLGFKTSAVSAKVTHRTLRFVGYRRILVFGLGVGVGLLLAPVPGAKLREKLLESIEGFTGRPPADLADQVRDELSSSPRTWHLPQPVIGITDGKVVLTGDVPHATAAADLERAARGVRGVVDVENRLRITGTDGG
ncbi:MAG: BON domain-containing protein [Acidimicrobiales bacterium]